MALSIRRAELPDCETVGEILREAVDWLAGRGMPMWRGNELDGAGIASEVDAGYSTSPTLTTRRRARFAITSRIRNSGLKPDRTTRPTFTAWRSGGIFSRCGISAALLAWTAQRTASIGQRFLQLDCEVHRTRLRALYEEFGFRHHSYRQAGPYYVA